MDTKQLTLQSIPKRYIEKIGVEKAYIQAKLCHLQLQATTTRADRIWFSCPIGRRSVGKDKLKRYRPLEDLFPWRTSQQVHKMIVSPATTRSTRRIKSTRRDTSLEKQGYIEVSRDANNDNWNKTLWYSVPEKIILQGFQIVEDDKGKRKLKAKKDSAWCFNEDVATLGSVSRAIVRNIIEREFHLLGRKRQDKTYLSFNRNAIARETGLPLMTVSDIFRDFVTEEYKILSTHDNGQTHTLLVENRITDDMLKGRGEGRQSVATVVAIFESTRASNPFPTVMTKHPDNGLHAMVAAVEKQTQERRQVKPKKVRTRKRGKIVKLSDDILVRSYTKQNKRYWKQLDDDSKEVKEIRYRNAALSS